MSNSKNRTVSFKAAFTGLFRTIKYERNFQIELVLAIAAVALGAFLGMTTVEWAILTLTFMVVLGMELVNTAFEHLSDLQKPRLDQVVKVAKDVAAGAVLISSIGAVVVGILLFVPKLAQILL